MRQTNDATELSWLGTDSDGGVVASRDLSEKLGDGTTLFSSP